MPDTDSLKEVVNTVLDGEPPKMDTQNAKLVEFVDLYTRWYRTLRRRSLIFSSSSMRNTELKSATRIEAGGVLSGR